MTAIPTVHLNGTSKRELLQQLGEAKMALNNAMVALDRAAPNARDYYVQGPDAFLVAQGEHVIRWRSLAGIQRELDTIAEAVVDQKDSRP